MKLVYAAKARIPSEFAHAHQIVRMAEAFAAAGAQVTLMYAHYRSSPESQANDIWDFYGAERTFRVESLACLDWSRLARFLPAQLARKWEASWSEWLTLLTFTASLLLRLRRENDAIVYSRDTFPLWLMSFLWLKRARSLFLETHTCPATRLGRYFRRGLMKRIGGFVVITGQLRSRYLESGITPERLLVAHDGYRPEWFEVEEDRVDLRRQLGWSADSFVVGYAGRFQTMGMDKGIGVLADAVAEIARDPGAPPVRLALLGGPAEDVVFFRRRIASAGLPPETIWYGGHVRPTAVPRYLQAFDVCTAPFPWTEHFAHYASPMKLFEYMASGTPIVASDLPAIAEIVRDGQNGLLVPPGDASALAGALRRLRDDRALGSRLAEQAKRDVVSYSWQHRAKGILDWIGAVTDGVSEPPPRHTQRGC